MDTPAQCIRCGRAVPSGARYCPGCGQDLLDHRPRLATGLLPVNQVLHQRYMVLRKLAQGGQSAVYLVADMLDGGQQRAIKEMSESNLGPAERDKAISDFMREAEMLRSMDHPALTKVYGTFVEGQKHYLVMEYVKGHNLEDEMIAANRPLEWERVVVWGSALCDVLGYLHQQTPPIIYRDLKPANVMLTPDGSIKLIDFGIARWLHPLRTRDTAQLGTDGYAPLEQYSARSETRSDLYALGASLYHLLTGRVPEAAPSRIAGQALTPIRSISPMVPEAVERIVLKALALQARDRYSTAAQMREVLEWVRSPEASNGIPRPTYGPAPSSGRIRTSGPAPASGSTVIGRHTVAPVHPKLYVWPLRLDAGFLEVNETTTLQLDVANRGGGRLTGKIATNLRCIIVEPMTVDQGMSELTVRIHTAGLAPGSYTGHITIHTTGGTQTIPVRFTVRPPVGHPELRRRRTGY
jgi:serine/threonine protein kinase